MTARTRYFVVASLLVLTVGLGTGLIAYYVGLPLGALANRGPAELQFVPADATVLAYVDVQSVMQSEMRERLRRAMPGQADGQAEFSARTGINIDQDIDRVVVAIAPQAAGDAANSPPSVIVLARGRFNASKIESLMREHGAAVEDYKGARLIVADQGPRGGASLSFIEPGLAAIGTSQMVRRAVDLKDGGPNVSDNDDIMNRVATLGDGNAWAVGRFDSLTGRLPVPLAEHFPAISWFTASAQINGGVRARLRAEARDEESANNLREVLRGIVALGRMQLNSRPELRAFTDSLQFQGTGNAVEVQFEVPAELFDALGAAASRAEPPPPPQ